MLPLSVFIAAWDCNIIDFGEMCVFMRHIKQVHSNISALKWPCLSRASRQCCDSLSGQTKPWANLLLVLWSNLPCSPRQRWGLHLLFPSSTRLSACICFSHQQTDLWVAEKLINVILPPHCSFPVTLFTFYLSVSSMTHYTNPTVHHHLKLTLNIKRGINSCMWYQIVKRKTPDIKVPLLRWGFLSCDRTNHTACHITLEPDSTVTDWADWCDLKGFKTLTLGNTSIAFVVICFPTNCFIFQSLIATDSHWSPFIALFQILM